jgi:Leucine-rich repeat (LRR) protein
MSVQQALSLKAQQLSALPAFVAELTELEVLDADQNVLTELPA